MVTPERQPEPRTSPPVGCICEWVQQDHGQQVSRVRVRTTPGCAQHDKPKRERR